MKSARSLVPKPMEGGVVDELTQTATNGKVAQRGGSTYQLKRRRLPDVRDSPEYPGADIDMEDI